MHGAVPMPVRTCRIVFVYNRYYSYIGNSFLREHGWKISQLALPLFIFLSFFCRTSGGKILHLNVCSFNLSLLFHPCVVSVKESPGVMHVMCNLYDTHSTSPRTFTLPVPFSSAKKMSLFLLAFLKHHIVVT